MSWFGRLLVDIPDMLEGLEKRVEEEKGSTSKLRRRRREAYEALFVKAKYDDGGIEVDER